MPVNSIQLSEITALGKKNIIPSSEGRGSDLTIALMIREKGGNLTKEIQPTRKLAADLQR